MSATTSRPERNQPWLCTPVCARSRTTSPGWTSSGPAALLAVAKKDGDQGAGEEELDRRRYAAAPVPTAQAVAGEELATAWPREAKDVFEVGKGSRQGSRDSGIERSAHIANE